MSMDNFLCNVVGFMAIARDDTRKLGKWLFESIEGNVLHHVARSLLKYWQKKAPSAVEL